jgi:hypothetical protein
VVLGVGPETDYQHPVGRYTFIPGWATPRQRGLMERYNALMLPGIDALLAEYRRLRIAKDWAAADQAREYAKRVLRVIFEVLKDGTVDWRR